MRFDVHLSQCEPHLTHAGASPLSFAWGDGFIGTQTYLAPKLSFSLDFGHFILKMVEKKNKIFMCQEKKILK